MAEYQVRVGLTEPVTLTCERNDVAFNLTGATSITLYRKANTGVTDSTNTAGLLSVSDAANGEITLTPNATWWATGIKYYDVYIMVVKGGQEYEFPYDDDMATALYHRFHVIENFE